MYELIGIAMVLLSAKVNVDTHEDAYLKVKYYASINRCIAANDVFVDGFDYEEDRDSKLFKAANDLVVETCLTTAFHELHGGSVRKANEYLTIIASHEMGYVQRLRYASNLEGVRCAYGNVDACVSASISLLLPLQRLQDDIDSGELPPEDLAIIKKGATTAIDAILKMSKIACDAGKASGCHVYIAHKDLKQQ